MIVSLTVALLLTGTDQAALHAAAASTCAAFPLRTTGTIHYFCDCQAGAEAGCVAGDDANPGTSRSAPKRRWYAAALAFQAMSAGDTIALCRGGAWSLDTFNGACGLYVDPGPSHDAGSAWFTNTKCASPTGSLTDPTNPSTCDVRDYTPPWGGTHQPLLAIAPLSSLHDPGGTTSQESVILGVTGAASGVRVMNLELRGSTWGPDPAHSTEYGGDLRTAQTGIYQGSCGPSTNDDWLICGNTFTGLAIGLHMEENGSTAARWNVWGNRFAMTWLDGILSGPGDHGRFDANEFEDAGGWWSPHMPAHAIYPNSRAGTSASQVVNNEIRYTTFPASVAVISGHGQWTSLHVENNLIDCGATPVAGCWGMKLDSGNGSGSTLDHWIRDSYVRRNLIRASSAGIGLGQVQSSVVENNVIVMVGGATDWQRAVLIPSESVAGAPPSTRITVRNNTIYMPTSDANGAAIHLGWEGEVESGHVIANNAVFAGGPLTTCFITPLGSGGYARVGNNACFQGTWGTTYDATAHLTADPLFVNPPGDLSLQPASPLRGAGDPAYEPAVDFLGNARPAAPSIGAHDVGSASGGSSSGGGSSSSGGSGGGGKGAGGGCGTAGGGPVPLAGLVLLALVLRRRRAVS